MIQQVIIRSLIAFVCILPFTGCTTGLKLWQKGDYFRSERSQEFDPRQITRIGVYVFSNGEAIDATDARADALDVLSMFGMLPFTFMSPQRGGSFTIKIGINPRLYPDEVKTGTTFEPDTSNTDPSVELATRVSRYLYEIGYEAQPIAALGHSQEISVEDCLSHARSAGYEGAFIVYYSGLNAWKPNVVQQLTGLPATGATPSPQKYSGYLYLPNAGLFSVATGKRLWATTNYGIIEWATLPNLMNEPFIKVESSAVIENGDEDHIKAADKAVKTLFDPTYWHQNFQEFPEKGQPRKKL